MKMVFRLGFSDMYRLYECSFPLDFLEFTSGYVAKKTKGRDKECFCYWHVLLPKLFFVEYRVTLLLFLREEMLMSQTNKNKRLFGSSTIKMASIL